MKVKALFYQNAAGFSASLIMLAMAISAFFIERNAGYALSIAFVLVLLINIVYSALSLKTVINNVTAVNKTLINGEGDGVDSFPLPAVMCDKAGNIIWYNNQFFEDIIDDCEIKKLSIKNFFEDFDFNEYSKKRVSNASFSDKEYTAFIVNVNNSSKQTICFYFFDDTAYKSIQREFVDSRPFVMMMLIDNIESFG